MPTYRVTIDNRTFRVKSDRPLTDQEAYDYARPQYETLRAEQVKAEQAGPRYQIGAAGLEQAGKEVGQGMSGFQRGISGFGGGLQSIAHGIDEILPGQPLQRLAGTLAPTLGVESTTAKPEEARAVAEGVASSGWQGRAGDILGRITPTVALPANALPKLGAISSSMPRLANVIGTMLTAGGTTALTTPGDAAKRAEAGLWSGALAGALPTATTALGAVRRGTTQAGRDLSRAEMIRAQLARSGQDENAVLAALRGPYEGARAGVQPTVGMLTENPALMRIEQGSRSRAYDVYDALDQANAAARWNALGKVAGTPQELAALEGIRTAATGPARNAAFTIARVGGGGYMGPLENAAKKVLADPNSTAAEGRAANLVLGRIQAKLSEAGDDPAALYAIRKDITEGIKSLAPDEAAALRGANRVRMQLVNTIDETLDKASNGVWSKYMQAYQDTSAPITSMRAGQAIQAAMERGTPAGLVPPGMGMKPAPVTLARQIKTQGEKQFGSTWKDRLLPEDREMLDVVARDLVKQTNVNLPPNRIGSPTAPLLSAEGAAADIAEGLVRQGANLMGGPIAGNAVGAMTAAARQATKNRSEIALARLLQDPAALSDMILKARRAEQILGATTEPSRIARGLGNPWEQ